MVKSNVISAMNANRLFWLGRYEERVYKTLHLLRMCYDAMIDGLPDDYNTFWEKLDGSGNYTTQDDFTFGMMYDESNPASVLSSLISAQDNAMLLRGYIATETLAYLEMSVALMRKLKSEGDTNIIDLQPVTDWSMAFWGSIEERIIQRNILLLMSFGRHIECMDMLTRYDYPFERIRKPFDMLKLHSGEMPDVFDMHIMEELDKMLVAEKFNLADFDYKSRLIKLTNILVRV